MKNSSNSLFGLFAQQLASGIGAIVLVLATAYIAIDADMLSSTLENLNLAGEFSLTRD